MENLGVSAVDATFWRGRRVFLTGHTGFKGSWLSLWLQNMDAHLRGYALAPVTTPALFNEARVAHGMDSIEGDVRDLDGLCRALVEFKPEVVIHMAAQPLVRLSYVEPVQTFQTNVMGSIHLLEAVRRCASVRSVVNVTTDKCYENREWAWGYRETEAMGGHDPYSSSKGCAELVTAAYRHSFLAAGGVAVASARAGNVIGGGDWAADRLVPDILRALQAQTPVIVRNPSATRPWQHVLEPLSGYLLLAQRLHESGQRFAEAWNFGPGECDAQPVSWVADRLVRGWGSDASWQQDRTAGQPHEAHYLKLDISKARSLLDWTPRWNLETALERVVAWHQVWLAGNDMRAHCSHEIAAFSATQLRGV